MYTEYGEILVPALDDRPWGAVSRAYQELNRVNWEAEGSEHPQTPEQLMAPLDQVDLMAVGIAVVEARQALAPIAAPPDRCQLEASNAEEVANTVFPSPEALDEALEGELEDEGEG